MWRIGFGSPRRFQIVGFRLQISNGKTSWAKSAISNLKSEIYLRGEHAAESAFQLEQFAFYVEAATVAAQGSIRRDHTVTWDDDRDWITVIGHANGPKSLRTAD